MHNYPLQSQDTTMIHAGKNGAIIQYLVGGKRLKNDSICADLVVV